MRIYLTGYMGSGKSTAGKKLARKLNLSFVDLDKYIEHKYKISVAGLFRKYDEKAFRLIEQEALRDTFEMDRTIISTGGGTPCFFDNMVLMKQYGLTVYLKTSVKSLVHRLTRSKKNRPLLKDKSPEELFTFIENQVHEREAFYLQSDIVVKGEDIDLDELAESILTMTEKSDVPVIDSKNRIVNMPEDLKAALEKGGVLEKFEKMPVSHKREYVTAIEEAKKPETREKRIEKTIEMLQKK